MEVLLVKFITLLILPPGIQFLLIGLGAWIKRRYYHTGTAFILIGFITLLLASLPIIADFNLRQLQADQPLAEHEITTPSAGAIVVLGGGRIRNAPEYGQDIPNSAVLQRLRYAARLHKKTGLPILVSGGNVYASTTISEARLMQQVLEEEMGSPVKWVEDQSRNTWENAVFSQQLLSDENIEKVIVVTQARHMTRAEIAFNAVGLIPLPAPTAFTPVDAEQPLFLRLLPHAGALNANAEFMHEVMGITWYKLRYIRSRDD